MADTGGSFIDMGKYSVPGATVKSPVEAKRESVSKASSMKSLLLSTPEDLHVAATAYVNGNDMAQSELIQDLSTLSRGEIAAKYGDENLAQVGKFHEAVANVRMLKERERTTGQAIDDTIKDTIGAGLNMAGGAAVLAAQGVDAVTPNLAKGVNAYFGKQLLPETGDIAPHLSAGLSRLNEAGMAAKSDLYQQRAAQHQLESSLNNNDTEAAYAADTKGMAAGASLEKTPAWFAKQGQDFGNALSNYGDDPIMLGSLVTEAVGSMIPSTMAIKALGKAGAMSTLANTGIKGAAAEAALKTAAGKALVTAGAEKAAPFVVGIGEAGSSAAQAQQELLATPEAYMYDNQDYLALRRAGRTHEQSMNELASVAGNAAAITTLPGAMLAGKLTAKFDANPLSLGGALGSGKAVGASAVKGAVNVAKEGVEEALQEASNQLGVNVGMNAAGEDVSLDRNVASGAAEGLIGGIGSAAAMQSPGVAAGTAKEVLAPVVNAGKDAVGGLVKMREKAIEAVADGMSASGSAALSRDAVTAKADADTIIETLAPAPAEAASETDAAADVVDPVEHPVAAAVRKATYLDQDETPYYAEIFKDMPRTVVDDVVQPIERSVLIEAAGKVLKDTAATDDLKYDAAMAVMNSMDSMRELEADAVTAEVDALPADSPVREKKASLASFVSKNESSDAVKNAEAVIQKLTAADIDARLPIEDMKAGTLSPEMKDNVAAFIGMVGRINVGAVNPSYYDMVRNQINASDGKDVVQSPKQVAQRKALNTSLEVSRDIAMEADKATAAKLEILARQEAAIAALPVESQAAVRNAAHKTKDIVREEIYTKREQAADPNKKGMLSLAAHRRKIGDAIAAGRTKEADYALEDLRRFAVTMQNKMVAINQSSENNDQKPVPYQAFGPYGIYEDKTGAFANARSIKSLAYAAEVNVDANTVAAAYNTMLKAYGAQIGYAQKDAIKIPELHQRMRAAQAKATKPQVAEVEVDDGIDTDSLVLVEKFDADPVVAKPAAPEVAASPAVPAASNEEVTRWKYPDGTEAPVWVSTDAANDPAAYEAEASNSSDAAPAVKRKSAAKAWFEWMATTALVPFKGVNRFMQSYKPKEEGSSFLDHESATEFLLENIDDLGEIMSGSSKKVYDLTDEQKDGLKHLLGKLVPQITEALQGRFAKALVQKQGEIKAGARKSTWLSDIETGDADALSFNKAMIANFAIMDDQGQYVIEPRVLQAAVLASLEFVLVNNARSKTYLKSEQVSDILGLPRRTRVTAAMRNIAKDGTTLRQALAQVSTKIEQLLGVSADKNASASYTQGLMRSLAANALGSLAEADVFTIRKHTLKIDKKDQSGNKTQDTRTYMMLSEAPDAAKSTDVTQVSLRAFSKIPDVFSSAFLPNAEKHRYIGKPPAKQASMLIGNAFSETSAAQKAVIKDRQTHAYAVNTPLFGFAKAIGNSALAEILGYTDLKDRKLNKAKVTKIEGKNASITSDIEGAEGYMIEAQAYADENGMDVGEVEIFFDWEISSVGRLQQRGPVTPQGNKITRELITITNATVDLLDPEGYESSLGDLWLAIAQSAGVKIEKLTRAESIAEAQLLMMTSEKLLPAVDIMRSYLDTGVMSQEQTKALQAVLKASKVDVTMKLMHAIFTVARIEQALDQGAEAASSFKTSLALEADGKTDGPINAMIHMTVGAFNEAYVQALAKGGWFFTKAKTTLNDHIKKDKLDLYNLAATAFNQKLSGMMKYLEPEEKAYTASMLRVMDALLPDFSIKSSDKGYLDAMTFGIERNLVKNPLTVFLYGSSVGGISAKVLGAMEDSLYTMLSEISESGKPWNQHPLFQKHPGLLADMNVLFSTKVSSKGELSREVIMSAELDLFSKPVDGTVSSEMAESLNNGISKFFGDPMSEAIDDVTGNLASNMKMTQQASQVQAIIFADVFNGLLEKRLAKYRADNKTTKLLPEAEMAAVFREAMRIAPIYETNDQEFHISGKEAVDNSEVVSSDMDGKLSATATLPAAGEASVKVSPYMTIGLGDGQMIMNIYLNKDGSLRATLPVFDGVEIGVDQVRKASEHINKAVYDGWMGTNTYRSIADGFSQMMTRTAGIESLSKESRAALKSALRLDRRDEVSNEHLTMIQDKLNEYADDADARKEALSKINSWVDHMAGTGSAHNNVGEMVEPEDVVDRLNELYEEALERIQSERAAVNKRPATDSHSRKNLAVVRETGTPVEGFASTYELNQFGAMALISKELGASAEQIELAQIIRKSGALKNVRIFRGSKTSLTRLKRKMFPDLDSSPIQQGQAFVGSGVIFLVNASPETVLHEAIHMFVSKAVRDFYRDPTQVPEHVADSLRRLEALALELVKIKPDSLPANMRIPLMTLRSQLLNKELSKDQRMDEFLAWTLANQNLSLLASKTRVHNPLTRIIQKALVLLKRMLKIQDTPGKDLLSRVRFEAQVLGSYKPERALAEERSETERGLNQIYGEDVRLQEVEARYINRMQAYLQSSVPDQSELALHASFQADVAELRVMAKDAAAQAQYHGFGMNQREQAAFEAVHSVMLSGMKMDVPLQRKANALYDHVLKHLSETELLAVRGLTHETASDEDNAEAAMQISMFTGDAGFRRTAAGRSDMMATFMALAQVNPLLREALDKLPAPQDAEIKWDSFDNALRSMAAAIINMITRFSISRASQSRTIGQQLDVLSGSISEVQTTHRVLAAIAKYNPLETANVYLAEKLETGTKALVKKLDKLEDAAVNPKLKKAFRVSSLVASIGSKDTSKVAGEELTKMLNGREGWTEVRALLNDLRGMTDSNKGLFRLMNRVKANVDAIRQDFREQVPENLAGAFTRKLVKHEWSRVHKGLAQADMLALGKAKALELLNDQSLVPAEILAAEEAVLALAGATTNAYKERAKALATWMVKREITSNHLQRNAFAIAVLAGEKNSSSVSVTEDLVKAIDKLVSLYAFDMLDGPTKATLAELAQTQADGMNTLAGYLGETRQAELDRLQASASGVGASVSRLNGWKGYVPALAQEGASVKVADDLDTKDLVRMGWKRIGTYHGDRNESYKGSRSYFQTTVGTRNAFRQGVAQTVHATWQGVDVRTGLSQTQEVSGSVYGTAAKRVLDTVRNQGVNNSLRADVHLLPVFDALGNVVAYERPMEADKLSGLSRDTHLGRMLGVWSGRISEESESDHFNKELIHTLKDVYDAEKVDRSSEYVNLADKNLKDKIYQDAWDTLGWRIKQDAAEIYGKTDFFPVRRDMIDNAVGYRAAGITDAFTGTTRWSEDTQNKIVRASTFIVGNNAFLRMKQAENVVQDAVSYAKTNIVVRGIKVVVNNVVGNNFHLLFSGVSIPDVLKGNRDKFLEITSYVKNREQILALNVELAGVREDGARAKVIKARITAYEDANDKLSIKPLIAAGELSTVSENLTEADVAIREGRIAEYIEKATEKVPGYGKTMAKNLLITKDTAIYQGLNRAVQYGDFVAKAILFDHLTQKKGMTEREALDAIAEEFVNYNRLGGRGRDALESMGLVWFYNYKLRITKIAVKMMRERPLTALLMTVGAEPTLGADTALSSSIVGKFLEGSLPYSIGPEMGFHSFDLVPIVALTT